MFFVTLFCQYFFAANLLADMCHLCQIWLIVVYLPFVFVFFLAYYLVIFYVVLVMAIHSEKYIDLCFWLSVVYSIKLCIIISCVVLYIGSAYILSLLAFFLHILWWNKQKLQCTGYPGWYLNRSFTVLNILFTCTTSPFSSINNCYKVQKIAVAVLTVFRKSKN